MGILKKLMRFFNRTKPDGLPVADGDGADYGDGGEDRSRGDGVSKVDFYTNPGTYGRTPKPGIKSKRPFDFGYVEEKKDTNPWEDFKKSYKDTVKKEGAEK